MDLICGCNSSSLVPRILKADGTYIYPAISPDGLFTIELADLGPDTEFVAVAGNGVTVTPGGDRGHAPTIEVCVDPASPVPLSFANVGSTKCLRATLPTGSDPHWGPASTITMSGITVVPGGVNGHAPTFQLSIAPGAPFSIDSSGRLQFTSTAIASLLAAANLADIGNIRNRNGDPPKNGQILMFDEPQSSWFNWPLAEAIPAVLGVSGRTIAPPPLTGPPVYFKFDPSNRTFGWNPA